MPESTTVTAMIESPKGSNQKFDYDPAEKRFKLSKIPPAGMVFPFDFGMIPGTQGEDGDPLDIMVISEGAAFPGCLVDRFPAPAIGLADRSSQGIRTLCGGR